MPGRKIEGTQFIFVVNSLEHSQIAGTCFGHHRSGVLLTAAHVVQDLEVEKLEILALGPSGNVWPVERIEYRAFELPFPAFPGQSGSVVLRADHKTEAIGIVTESITYASEENGEPTAQAHWTIAASLTPIRDWIDSL